MKEIVFWGLCRQVKSTLIVCAVLPPAGKIYGINIDIRHLGRFLRGQIKHEGA